MKKTVLLLTVLLCSLAQGQFWENPNQKPSLFGMRINRAHILGDPVALWLMNENKASKVYDLSGNGNTGTFQGTAPSWSAGKFGSAVSLPGTNEYISLGSSIRLVNGSQPFTFIWWEKVHTTPAEHQSIASFYPDGGSQQFLIFRSSNAAYKGLTTGLGNSGSVLQWENAPAVNDAAYLGVWRMWALVGKAGMDSVTAGDWTLYIDGISQAPTDITNLASLPNPFNDIGRCGDSGIAPWKGMLDLSSFYNRTLSAYEIALLYREPFCFMRPSWDWILYGGIAPAVGIGQVIFIY